MREPVTILTERDLRALVPLDLVAINCVEDAFRALATKPVAMPPIVISRRALTSLVRITAPISLFSTSSMFTSLELTTMRGLLIRDMLSSRPRSKAVAAS